MELARPTDPKSAKTTPPDYSETEKKDLLDTCDDYLFKTPRRLAYRDRENQKIANCAAVVRDALKQAQAELSAATNAELIKLRVNFKVYKKWVCERSPVFREAAGNTTEECASPSPKDDLKPWIEARKVLGEIDMLLPVVLKAKGLFAQFAAVLVTGVSFADANQPDLPAAAATAATPAATAATTDAKKDQTAVGTIVWQSRHFGDVSLAPVDIHLGGRIGVAPVLNLVAPNETAAGSSPTTGVTAVHQTAFVWNFGVHVNRQLPGMNAEWGGFVRTGSSMLMSLPKVVDRGDASFIAFPLDKGSAQTSWLWESGVEFNIFDTRLEQIHAEKGTLTPQFQLMLAVRKDERFRGGIYDAYENPTGRLIFRLMLDAIQVLDRRQFGDPGKPFTFGFVVEHERSLTSKGVRMPPATRFILRGSLDLLKGLTESPKKAGAAPAPAGAP